MKITLLDGYSLMYRAYHGLQTPMTAPDGTPTNAVHGFLIMLIKVLEEEKPDAMAVAFDMHAKTFRAQKYEAYKATRKPMPDDLRVQDGVIRELIGLMHIPILEREGYEADDILGTVSAKGEREGDQILLVTGDRDSFQLSGEHTTILYTRKGITDTARVTPAWIRETYGVEPLQLIDVKGLMGDTSDNIPGVPGVGEKTALKLIQQYGTLHDVLESADRDQKGKLRERLLEHRDLAELSLDLATIDRAVPIDIDYDAWRIGCLTDALPRLRSLGMVQAARRLSDVSEKLGIAAQPEDTGASAAELPPIEQMDSLERMREACAILAAEQGTVAIDIGAEMTVATAGRRLTLPLGQADLLSVGIEPEQALAALEPLLASECRKVLYSLKDFPANPDTIRGDIHDCMLAAYALNAERPSFRPAARLLCVSKKFFSSKGRGAPPAS